MKRPPKQSLLEERPMPAAAAVTAIMQVKVWLLGISPMVWRRVLVPAAFTLREPHGVIQVAMGWEGTHLFQFCLRAVRYGSSELSASSPDVTLAALRLERAFALVLDRGGMRRAWLRGREKVQKRYLIHVAGYNLGLIMRLLTGAGTPRELWAAVQAWFLGFMLPDGGLIVVLVLLLGKQTAVLAVAVQPDPLA
jgi:hypothetical protein